MNTRNVNVKTATKAHSKRYGQPRWEIMFFGQSASGSIPMFSRVTAQTAAEAKARFISLLNPVSGYFLGSYGHLWCMGNWGRWRILLIDFVQDFNNREMIRHDQVYPTGVA